MASDMAYLSLVDAVELILHSVAHVPTSAFLSRCSELQLEPTHLAEPDFDSPGFPQYDASHTFVFETDGQAPAFFDVLAYRDRIIQIRLTVHCRLSAQCDKHVGVILPLLVGRYGPGIQQPHLPNEPLVFADDKTDAYLSRISETLFVNVGDREVWRLAGGVVMMVEP